MRSPLLASLVSVCALSGLAAADPLPPRVGLELGVGLQAGKIYCSSEGNFCNGFTEAGYFTYSATVVTCP